MQTKPLTLEEYKCKDHPDQLCGGCEDCWFYNEAVKIRLASRSELKEKIEGMKFNTPLDREEMSFNIALDKILALLTEEDKERKM